MKVSSAVVKQTILSLSVSLAYFCIGLVRGYSAPAVPSMNDISPGLLPDKNIASWISSIPPFGAFFGSLVSAPLMHFIGRKYTVLVSSPIWALSWIAIALSTHWGTILAGRMLSGFCAGLVLPAAQIYVSESSDPKIRGIIGTIPSLSMSMGILVIYVLGKYLSWQRLAWTNSIIAALMFFVVANLPDSPVWLKSKMKLERAQASAKWLHLTGFEVAEVNGASKTDAKDGTAATVRPTERHFSKEALMRREILMPLGIGLALLMIQQLSGIDAVIFFTVEIFRSAGSTVDGHTATIIVGLVQVLSNFSSLFVVDRYGRKPLLIISGLIMSVAMGSMGAAFYLNSMGNKCFGFLPVTSLIIFMVGFSFGFGCIPFLLMGELFPTAQRSLLSSLAGSFNLAVMFIVIKTYHPLEGTITTAGTFWMYSVLCACGVVFVIFVVPETKGRELESIYKLFIKQRRDSTCGTAATKNGHENPAVVLDDEQPRAAAPVAGIDATRCNKEVQIELDSKTRDTKM